MTEALQPVPGSKRKAGQMRVAHVADFASPVALHHDPIEIKIRMLAFDAPVLPRGDHGAGASCSAKLASMSNDERKSLHPTPFRSPPIPQNSRALPHI